MAVVVLLAISCSDNKTGNAGMMDYAYSKVFSKIFLWVALAMFGTLAVLFRKVFSAADKITQQSILGKVKTDPSKAVDYAETLDMPYTVLRDISGGVLALIKNKLVPGMTIANYKYFTHVLLGLTDCLFLLSYFKGPGQY